MKKVLLAVMIMVICLSLVACSSTSQTEENVKEEVVNTQENSFLEEPEAEKESEEIDDMNEESETAQETIENMKFYSDDTKYVITLEDNTRGIYYHDGNKITGYEIRVTYESHEEAELAKEEFEKEEENEEEDIKSVRVEGNELIAEFGPGEYEDTTIEEIETAFELLKSVQENNQG